MLPKGLPLMFHQILAKLTIMLGAIEVENKTILKAREYLNKAIKWNAFHFASIFENIETYKMIGDLEQFYQLTLQSHI